VTCMRCLGTSPSRRRLEGHPVVGHCKHGSGFSNPPPPSPSLPVFPQPPTMPSAGFRDCNIRIHGVMVVDIYQPVTISHSQGWVCPQMTGEKIPPCKARFGKLALSR
jgi:hypothetical protein